MDFLIQLFYGVFFVLIGTGIVRYRRVVKSWTGNFVWAEKYIGNGGTYFVLLIFGLAMIFYGAMYPFGGVQLLFNK